MLSKYKYSDALPEPQILRLGRRIVLLLHVMERSSGAHTSMLPWSPPGWQHTKQCPDRGFPRPGLWHSSPSLDAPTLFSVVFVLILELLTYPKTPFNLSPSKLFSFVYNKESKEVEMGKPYSSGIWAVIARTKACILFLCLYWWSQRKSLVVSFFTQSWRHSLVQESASFPVQGKAVDIWGYMWICVAARGLCPCSVKAAIDHA